MTGLALWTRSGPRVWLSLAVAAASILALVPLPTRAMSEDNVFQQAVNYIFTGCIRSEGRPRHRGPEGLHRPAPRA